MIKGKYYKFKATYYHGEDCIYDKFEVQVSNTPYKSSDGYEVYYHGTDKNYGLYYTLVCEKYIDAEDEDVKRCGAMFLSNQYRTLTADEVYHTVEAIRSEYNENELNELLMDEESLSFIMWG